MANITHVNVSAAIIVYVCHVCVRVTADKRNELTSGGQRGG